MSEDTNFWYRLGYALERQARRLKPGSGTESGGDAPARRESSQPPAPPAAGNIVERLLTAGVSAVALRVLDRWEGRGSPSAIALIRAAAAGAVAALLLELVEPLLVDDEELSLGEILSDGGLLDEVAGGAGAGLVYAALVEPRVPGPALARGAVFGTVEYLVSPWGGLGKVLAPMTPQERIPFLEKVLAADGRAEDGYLQHLLFALALAEIYALTDG